MRSIHTASAHLILLTPSHIPNTSHPTNNKHTYPTNNKHTYPNIHNLSHPHSHLHLHIRNVYWTDQGSDDYDRRVKRDNENAGPRISVAKTDGRYVRMLIINGLDKPGAIAVNPRRG